MTNHVGGDWKTILKLLPGGEGREIEYQSKRILNNTLSLTACPTERIIGVFAPVPASLAVCSRGIIAIGSW